MLTSVKERSMEVSSLLVRGAIDLNMSPASKTEWIEQLVDLLVRAYRVQGRDEILRAVLEREATLSTAIGNGVAVPHAKVDGVPRLLLAFGRAPQGVDFDSPDGKPVYAAFLLVSPKAVASPHVQALAAISRIMIRDGVTDRVLEVGSPRAFIRLLKAEEAEL